MIREQKVSKVLVIFYGPLADRANRFIRQLRVILTGNRYTVTNVSTTAIMQAHNNPHQVVIINAGASTSLTDIHTHSQQLPEETKVLSLLCQEGKKSLGTQSLVHGYESYAPQVARDVMSLFEFTDGFSYQ